MLGSLIMFQLSGFYCRVYMAVPVSVCRARWGILVSVHSGCCYLLGRLATKTLFHPPLKGSDTLGRL